MTRLVWGEPDKRLHEIGVDRGVFYPLEGMGVPWDGLMAVSEAPSDGDVSTKYFDGSKFQQQRQVESFAATIKALSYPPEFEEYDGSLNNAQSQNRKTFDFSYRTLVGNALDPISGYKIHLVYNALASPSPRDFSSLGGDTEAITFTWDITTIPEEIPSGGHSAHLIIDPSVAHPWVIEDLENLLYGTNSNDPKMPTMGKVLEMFESGAILRIVDHGDGTWTATGPDEAIKMLSSTMFEITWPSAIYIDTETYKISSL
jgi:hypothetical protein